MRKAPGPHKVANKKTPIVEESGDAQTASLDSVYEVFVVVAPGLEDLAAQEILEWYPGIEVEPTHGGLTVHVPLHTAFAFNRCLKIPTRVLVRLVTFGCRDFPKLFRKISGFPWEQWFADESQVEFHASTKASRLRMKKRIEETCSDGRKARLKKRQVVASQVAAPTTAAQTVFVRIDEDVCTLSLDTSGELLHKRHMRPLSSEAPLRETIAAALLLLLHKNAPPTDGNEATDLELVDPMTGGGTFLIEGAILRRQVTTRPFAFEQMPIAVGGTSKSEKKVDAPSAPRFTSFVGYDVSEKALSSARENLRLALGPDAETRSVDLKLQDFFAAEPMPERRRWLVVNPPYGERIKVEGRLADFYERLIFTVDRVARPELACFLLPEKALGRKLNLPSGWKLLEKRRFLNGGLPVAALVFESANGKNGPGSAASGAKSPNQ